MCILRMYAKPDEADAHPLPILMKYNYAVENKSHQNAKKETKGNGSPFLYSAYVMPLLEGSRHKSSNIKFNSVHTWRKREIRLIINAQTHSEWLKYLWTVDEKNNKTRAAELKYGFFSKYMPNMARCSPNDLFFFLKWNLWAWSLLKGLCVF